MPHKNKAKDGNGARTQEQKTENKNVPMARQESSGLPAPVSANPLSRLRNEIDSLFDRFLGGWPALPKWNLGADRFWDVDMEETDKEILVRAETPGFEPKDFDIHVDGNLLTIRGEHKQESEENQGESHRWERRYGRFERSIMLPGTVDTDKVDAQYRNGVLELRLPRTEQAHRRRIEVKP
jgi:HSP20 family protein